jgi:hypothetical protein
MKDTCRPFRGPPEHFSAIRSNSWFLSSLFWKSTLIFFVLGALFFTRIPFGRVDTLLALIFTLFFLMTVLSLFTYFHCYTPILLLLVALLVGNYFFLDSLSGQQSNFQFLGFLLALLLLLLIWVTIRILSTHHCYFLWWLVLWEITTLILLLALLLVP